MLYTVLGAEIQYKQQRNPFHSAIWGHAGEVSEVTTEMHSTSGKGAKGRNRQEGDLGQGWVIRKGHLRSNGEGVGEISVPIAPCWEEHFEQREQRVLPEAGAGLECPSRVQGAARLEQGACREGPGQNVLRTGR